MRPGAPGTPTTMPPSLLCGLGLIMLAATVAGRCDIAPDPDGVVVIPGT